MKDDEIENNKNIQEKESIKDIQKEESDNIKTKKNKINDKEEPLIKDMIETK